MSMGPARLQSAIGSHFGTPVRHGKRLGLPIGDAALIVHLGMTGRWVSRPPGDAAPRFGKIGLGTAEQVAWFCDSRRFGSIVPTTRDAMPGALVKGHGPDALSEPLGPTALAERFTTRQAIKPALMDQARIAGLGNIQAAESLFRARIDPQAMADSLTPDAWHRLTTAIATTLHHTLAATDGREVAYMSDGAHVKNPFDVYGRADEPCVRCARPIERFRQSGRVTFWCPRCQA